MLLIRCAYALTEDQKRTLFLKAHEEMQIDTGSSHRATSHKTSKPKPRPARHHARPRANSHHSREEETHTHHHATPEHEHSANRHVEEHPRAHEETHHEETHVAHPAATPAPTPARVAPIAPHAPITISKSGYEASSGAVAPPPEEAPHGFWLFNLFRHHSSGDYRYLTPSVRRSIDHPNHSVRSGRWRYIVVHNSGTNEGNAKAFDYYHRHVRHMPNGLAYQFVIDNGHGGPDGRIEIGNRWVQQLQGGHVHSDYLNNIALGICLVGDFNRHHPTKAQLTSLEELIRYLERRVGKVDGHWPLVVPHRAINPPRWQTDCPGNLFPYSWLRSNFPPPSARALNRLQYDRRVPSSDR